MISVVVLSVISQTAEQTLTVASEVLKPTPARVSRVPPPNDPVLGLTEARLRSTVRMTSLFEFPRAGLLTTTGY